MTEQPDWEVSVPNSCTCRTPRPIGTNTELRWRCRWPPGATGSLPQIGDAGERRDRPSEGLGWHPIRSDARCTPRPALSPWVGRGHSHRGGKCKTRNTPLASTISTFSPASARPCDGPPKTLRRADLPADVKHLLARLDRLEARARAMTQARQRSCLSAAQLPSRRVSHAQGRERPPTTDPHVEQHRSPWRHRRRSRLAARARRYRAPSQLRSLFEIAITAVPFVLLWILMWASLEWSYLLGLAIAVPAAGFLVRLFMIQHDCGHGSFFRRRWANDWTGRAISVLTFTPYDHWRRSHAVHHASSGNLDRRGIGDITTLTVAEYLARPWWRRLAYRCYRHPLVMFGIGPAYQFLVQHRFPAHGSPKGWRSWLSPMATNAAIALLAGSVIWLVGVKPFLLVQLPIILLAASIGVWLFYVQHQFEDDALGRGRRLDGARGRPAWQLALRLADGAALVHGQHRRAPRAPPMQPHPLLSPRPRSARSPRAAECRTHHPPSRASPVYALRCGTRREGG